MGKIDLRASKALLERYFRARGGSRGAPEIYCLGQKLPTMMAMVTAISSWVCSLIFTIAWHQPRHRRKDWDKLMV